LARGRPGQSELDRVFAGGVREVGSEPERPTQRTHRPLRPREGEGGGEGRAVAG
jgi:hypothetical protein